MNNIKMGLTIEEAAEKPKPLWNNITADRQNRRYGITHDRRRTWFDQCSCF